MQNSFEQLKEKLREIFQLDRGDLEFGIYRIMNAKAQQINEFLENELLSQVQEILKTHQSGEATALKHELEVATDGAEKAGVSLKDSPKVQKIKAQLAKQIDTASFETEIYSDLYNFFRRYYSEGDFMALRRYKEGIYAMPYEGEEVKLHWANHDQYYIKTSENFKHYTFKMAGKRVRFQITSASTEKNNNKETRENQRRFMLYSPEERSEEPIFSIAGETLTIRFSYSPYGGIPPKQESINKDTVQKIFNFLPEQLQNAGGFLTELRKFEPTEKNPERTLLEKHLNTYTAKNSFDYFIHKDLGGFLRRELDFFIKNEIMYLDDIENETSPKVTAYLGKIKALRQIGGKVIQFLEQLENFQKKLWLKKKFVLETHYCITLDKIMKAEGGQELLTEIMANQAQHDEWLELFAINEIKNGAQGDALKQEYSTPLTLEFLRENDKLPVDTKFFGKGFKYKLLGLFEDLDQMLDGVLVNSENFQALNLLQARYQEQVQCIYIDPPYNTDSSAILYKNGYKHSSWMSFLNDRILASFNFHKNESIICVAIDDEEVFFLQNILSNIYEKHVGISVVRSNPVGRKTKGKFSPMHEYVLFYGNSEKSIPASLVEQEDGKKRYPHIDKKGRYSWLNFIRTGNNDLRSDSPKMYYPIIIDENDKMRIPKMEWVEESKEYSILEFARNNEIMIFPDKKSGDVVIQKNWQRGHERFLTELDEYRIRREGEEIKIDFKARMDENALPNTWWGDSKYASSNHGAAEMKGLFLENPFKFPKALNLVKDCLKVTGASIDENAIVLDYFAGSGTTGHAVIDLNREDGGKRKYILIEMGEYFDSVLKPRIQKAAYSDKWKAGKPTTRKGVSHAFKYLTLEQYEDALDNLDFNEAQANFLGSLENKVKQEYMLGYMLDVETRESLLDVDNFKNPFEYGLRITRGEETENLNIDLIETFNYLLGLRVQKITSFENGVITITGENPLHQQCLIIWRNCDAVENNALETWFKTHYADYAGELLYCNGDSTLARLKAETQNWQVNLTEAEFHRLMFAESE